MSENRHRGGRAGGHDGAVMDDEQCYRVASSRDGRFDGMFVTAVLTTGIYCRPSCPAMTPRRRNVRFYRTPAAAQEAGFRSCKRCRPDSAPGSPEWDARADVVARAVRLIADGTVEREGIAGLAGRLVYSPRQLHRLVSAEIGTGPLRLAVAHRVQNARTLLETTDLPVTEVAWAAGFSSIRRFNELIREVYALSPTEIRAAGRATRPVTGRPGEAAQVLVARLAYRPPMDLDATLRFLGRRAVPGAEEFDGQTYRAVLRLPHGLGVVTVPAVTVGGSRPAVECEFRLDDVRDYAAAVARLRRLLDLDADPAAVAADLSADPVVGPAVSAHPGRRVPGATLASEVALRAVLGQQVSVAAARSLAGRLTAMFGTPLSQPTGSLVRALPSPEALAETDPATFGLPRRRAATLHALATGLATGAVDLDPGCDREQAERDLLAVPGIGPWTAAYVRMRALGDPDVFPPGDLGLRRALARYDAATAGSVGPEMWKPWRSYAAVHLWASDEGPRHPQEEELS